MQGHGAIEGEGEGCLMWQSVGSCTKTYISMIFPDRGKWIFPFAVGCFVLLFVFESRNKKETVRFTLLKSVQNILLALELGMILAMTLSGRGLGGEYEWKLIPFWSWCEVYLDGSVDVLIQILANILLFIPLGFLLPCCFKRCRKYRYTILYSAILSLAIELIQGIAQIGLFETDDVIHNTLGACIGVGVYAVVRRRE